MRNAWPADVKSRPHTDHARATTKSGVEARTPTTKKSQSQLVRKRQSSKSRESSGSNTAFYANHIVYQWD